MVFHCFDKFYVVEHLFIDQFIKPNFRLSNVLYSRANVRSSECLYENWNEYEIQFNTLNLIKNDSQLETKLEIYTRAISTQHSHTKPEIYNLYYYIQSI